MSRLRAKGEHGQVLSSVVAVAGVVAIVAGLLVLFGTRGHDVKANEAAAASTPKTSTKPTTAPASVPKTSATPTPAENPSTPTNEPTTPPSSSKPEPTDPSATQPPGNEATTIPPDQRPAIEVYNNTQRKGLADSVAGRARQAGWIVAGSPDNWHGKIVASTVYYPPGMLAAANQLAHDLGIGRTKGALDNMKKDRLTVILTSDYPG